MWILFSLLVPPEKAKKELVWLCIGFLCAVASINPQCGLVSVWKHVSAVEKVCWRERGSSPTKHKMYSTKRLSPKRTFVFISL